MLTNRIENTIYYAQCWEDPRTLTEALEINSDDDVLSIASGGDNTFALLLEEPRTLTAIDRNPAQLFLLELKMRALKNLDYDDFVSFLGARPSDNREQFYRFLRPGLSQDAREYWDHQGASINRGIIHCGKFERYFSLFRRFVLPLMHTRGDVERLLRRKSLKEQSEFYDEVWDNERWRCFFRLFFGGFLLSRLGRHPSLFRYVRLEDIAEELLARTCQGLTKVPTSDNFFLGYILTGRYDNLESAHPYLRETTFKRLRKLTERLRLVCADVEDYLKSQSVDHFSKFNCSDIFEYMSDSAFEGTLAAIIRASREDARLAFWTLFVPRQIPRILAGGIHECADTAKPLAALDRTFFYGGFHVWKLLHKPVLGEIDEYSKPQYSLGGDREKPC